MLVVVLLVFVAGVNAKLDSSRPLTRWKCSEGAETTMTLNASEDRVLGRYTAERCSTVPRDVTSWRLDLWYFDNPAVCNITHTGPELRRKREHSKVIEDIHLNCTYACLSVDLDLIFTGCYSLQSSFYVNTSLPAFYTYHNITNQFQLSDFQKTTPSVTMSYHDKGEVVVVWYFGVALEFFTMELCDINNDTAFEDMGCVNVNDNCTSMGTSGSNEVECALRLELARCYKLIVQSRAPWATGMLRKVTNTHTLICPMEVSTMPPPVVGADAGVVYVCVAAAALVVAVLALAVVCRARSAAAHSKRVLWNWLHRTDEIRMVAARGTVGVDAGVDSSHVDVLLLYARESAAGQRAADMLRTLLQHVVTGKVYDVHSAEVTSLAARAPAAWIRAALQRTNMRVVLLQTPAAALYVTHASDTGEHITLGPPALGSGAVYRSPRFGDTLLQYALTLLADCQHQHTEHLYKKYFVAQFDSLPTELWPQLVRYRRYSLPAGAMLLLHDVSSGHREGEGGEEPQLQQLLEQFEHAVQEFVHQATANPDYLTDELILL